MPADRRAHGGNPNAFDAWNPTYRLTILRLRTDTRITSAINVDGWDADSIADFGDTLELRAIQAQDENHQPLLLHFILPDGNGPSTMLEIANAPPPTTTTTTTIPGATTTTTLPDAGKACGNCVDDNANGLVDFEEPACCPAAGVRAFTFRNARLVSAGTSSLLSVTATIAWVRHACRVARSRAPRQADVGSRRS